MGKQEQKANQLAAQVKKVSKKGLPPVHLWNPEFCGDIDIRIARNGDWFYQGSKFTRQSLVNLFSTVLRKDQEDYFLVTPVEKLRIQVDDAPFLITSISVQTEDGKQVLVAETNTGDTVKLGKDNPLWIEQDADTGEPSPYVRVRAKLDGLLSRSVFYQLVEMAVEVDRNGRQILAVESDGEIFELGSMDS